MKLPKHQVWKWRIALVILIAWICLDGVEIITSAEVRPPRRKRGLMINPEDLKKKEEITVDIGKSLVEIAQRANRQSTNQMVDLVFVVDGSIEMKRPGKIVEARIADMVSAFEEAVVDYQVGLVWFQNAGKTSRITVKPLQRGLTEIEENFRKVPPPRFKGSVAGHGLDAIMKGLEELQFRSDAEKHLVVVTNSQLNTSWGGGDDRNQVIGKILDWCKHDKIRINIIGISEEIQMQLTDLTDGKWYAIDKYQRRVSRAPMVDKSALKIDGQMQLTDLTDGKWYAIDKYQRRVSRAPMVDKSALKIDGIFRRIAQHIAETVKQPADIVFVYDSSLSMDEEVSEICTGLDTLVGILDSEALDYRFGIIRFWARSGGGESSMTITQPPLNAEQVKKLFQRPRQGDEHLLDAIMEGVPKLRTPDDRKLVLFVVTDEPSSSGPKTTYTSARAVEACRHAGAQVNVIGGIARTGGHSLSPDSGRGVREEFQRRAPAATNGVHHIMPGNEVLFQSRLIR